MPTTIAAYEVQQTERQTDRQIQKGRQADRQTDSLVDGKFYTNTFKPATHLRFEKMLLFIYLFLKFKQEIEVLISMYDLYDKNILQACTCKNTSGKLIM